MQKMEHMRCGKAGVRTKHALNVEYIDGQVAQGRYEHMVRPDMIMMANVLGRGVPAHGLSIWPKHDTMNRAIPT